MILKVCSLLVVLLIIARYYVSHPPPSIISVGFLRLATGSCHLPSFQLKVIVCALCLCHVLLSLGCLFELCVVRWSPKLIAKNAVHLKIVYIVDHVAATRTKDSCFDRSLPGARAIESEGPQASCSGVASMWFANVFS